MGRKSRDKVMNTLKWIGWMAAAALVVLTAGCHNGNPPRPAPLLHGEAFPADSDTRSVWDVRAAQAAAGARQDATLHAVHFDQAGLNSLGLQKLDLMLSDEQPTAPLIVYLDLSSDASIDADRQAVAAYLRDRGLQDNQIAIRDGANPHAMSSAADAVTNLHAMESPAPAQSGTPGSSVPVPQQGATSPGNPQPTYSSH
jgi:hypothetical protein